MLSTELWEEENKSTVCNQCIRSRTHAQYVISVVTLTACRCFLLLSEFWCKKSAQLQSLNFNIRMMVNVLIWPHKCQSTNMTNFLSWVYFHSIVVNVKLIDATVLTMRSVSYLTNKQKHCIRLQFARKFQSQYFFMNLQNAKFVTKNWALEHHIILQKWVIQKT